jgi:hypothetical protein
MSDDRFDANPYQSPEWSPTDDERVGGQHGSGTLTAPIHIKGTPSLDDVLRAYPGLIRGAFDLALWCFLLAFLVVLVGSAGIVFWSRAAQERSPGLFVLGVMLMLAPLGPLGAFLPQLFASERVRRLWKEQGGVFQYREVTVTDELITTTVAQGVAKTPWTDYAGYRNDRNTVWLYLDRRGLKRRREQCGMEERRSRFGINLDQADVFPRRQFDDDGDWGRFQWAVKHKLKKKP